MRAKTRWIAPGAAALALFFCPSFGNPAASGEAGRSDVRRVEFHRAVVNLEDTSALLTQKTPPSVRRGPEAPGDLWYGEISRQLPSDDPTSREHNVPFAVLFQGGAIVRAWSDANMNGDLSDDPEVPLSVYPGAPSARSFLTRLRWSARRDNRDVPIDRLVRVVVENADADPPRRPYRTQEVYGMLGTVEVDGTSRLALLYDSNHDGFYTRGNGDGVFFDLDGDRHFTIDPMAPDFGPFAIPFSLGRKQVVVDEVDPGGATLSLHALGTAVPAAAPAPGEMVPDFEYTGVDGHPVRLSAYRGRPVIVHFWSSWCSGCRRQAADLRALYDRHRTERLEILGVSYDTSRQEMEKFRQEKGFIWPTSFTGGFPAQDPVGRLFRETGSNVYYVVAPDGRLAGKVFEVDEVEQQLARIAGREEEQARARP